MARTYVRNLKADRILQTMQGLEERIARRFPDASLRGIAEELIVVVQESLNTVARIRQPNIWLRVGIGILGVGLLALIVWVASGVKVNATGLENLPDRVGLINNVITSSVFLLGLIGFLWSLEIRFKRQRALHALHELRSMAHIVDMHQLRKDPESFLSTGAPDPTKLPPIEMARYLQYCTELLAILSKLAALYVEGLPDPQTLEAADRLEALTTSLSRKIWQKISLLDTVFQPHLAPLRKTAEKTDITAVPQPTPTPST
jgi:hypothetical protein